MDGVEVGGDLLEAEVGGAGASSFFLHVEVLIHYNLSSGFG